MKWQTCVTHQKVKTSIGELWLSSISICKQIVWGTPLLDLTRLLLNDTKSKSVKSRDIKGGFQGKYAIKMK